MFLMKKLMSNVPELVSGSCWWKKPLYYNPVVRPLDRGPDFSFVDGRKPSITTKWELERRKKQVELGKQIVHYLNEIKIAEQLYEEQQIQKTHRNVRKLNIAEVDQPIQYADKSTTKKQKPVEAIQNKSPSKNEQIKQNLAIAPTVENLKIDAGYSKDRSDSKSPSRALTPKQTLRNVDERAMHRYKQDSSRLGKSSFAFAWILDQNEEERSRGVTMDIAKTSIETPSGKKIYILDAPGHKDFIPNMISGATQADAALLVVNSTRGEFETGFDQGGQTREHALLVRALGVSRLIVAVNKLDTADWSKERYDELCSILSVFLQKRTGFEFVQFVPVSGLFGINLVKCPPSDHSLAVWYFGKDCPTLVEALDSLPITSTSTAEQPLRIVVNDILRTSPTILSVSAKVEGGHVETGDKLFLMPEAIAVVVKALSIDESSSSTSQSSKNISPPADQQICFAGDQITLTLSGNFEPDSVYPGNVFCRGGT
uniref:Large ribosomal subunit protein mL52 n=1 Tax=Meloidogyne javanica TaxID=6303 RepID=A0A915MGT4_MELJA